MPSELDFEAGIGQGITLGAQGFALGGPVGGVIGGGIGLVKGLFGGRSRRRQERRLRRRNEQALRLLRDALDEAQGQTATDTAAFQTGRGALREAVDDQAQRDQGLAAARGLTGSGFEIGQAAARARALTTGTSRLVATSEAQLEERRQAALARYLQGLSLTGQTDLALLGASDRRAARRGQALGSAVEAAAGAGLFGAPTTTARRGSAADGSGSAPGPFIDSIPTIPQDPMLGASFSVA